MTIPSPCLKYFKDSAGQKKYGIYNNGLERFVTVSNDLWTVLQAAKLLSSKFSSTVCVINNPDINNDNCYLWGLTEHAQAKQDRQTPVIVLVNSVEVKGFPIDISEEAFSSDKKFIDFVLKATYALKLTDGLCNTGDQGFYNKFFNDDILSKIVDDSGVINGFVNAIEKILYFALNSQEALDKINATLTDKSTTRPGQLTIYKQTFLSFLAEVQC
jgi:hypothetical protein